MSDAYLTMSACDLGRGIAAGEIDPIALTEAFLTAAHATDPDLQIYARLTPDRARAEAAAAAERAKRGQRRSLLDGVPISWKDLYDTAGTVTESGSAFFAGRVPDQDATVLANATQAGLVCLGKTHMTELAFSGLGLNPITATPPNPIIPGAAPGGSSSGAAASVSHGIAAAGIGSDTGGSVRVPSAWNDLVGLKTTAGRLPLTGVVPLAASFDTVGPLCRTVEDAAHLFAAMAGTKPADLTGARLDGTRMAVLETVALDDLDDPVRAAFNHVVTRLQDLGVVIDRITLPEVAEAMALAGPIYTVECYATWADEIEAMPEKMYPPVRERFKGGLAHSGVTYVKALHRLEQLRATYAENTAAYDAVLTPTSAILPPQVDQLLADEAFFAAKNLMALRNTRIGNLMGLCGVTLPTGVPATGVLLNGAAGQDERLLRLAAAVEAALA